VGRAHGITEAELQAIPNYRDSEVFSDTDRLVLEFAEGLSRTPAGISDELFAQLREVFSPKQLVELAATVAVENFAARFNRAFDIRSQGFPEAAFCLLPERE
jgi:alkylhydroperoxidase family enzyme